MKSAGKSYFELLAGFRERRRLDVPFVDHLKLWLNDTGVAIYLEQGGRAQVRGKVSLKVCSTKGSLMALPAAETVEDRPPLCRKEGSRTCPL